MQITTYFQGTSAIVSQFSQFMPLIQFMLLIIGGFRYRDLRRRRTEARRIEARKGDDQWWRYAYKVGTAKQVIDAPSEARE